MPKSVLFRVGIVVVAAVLVILVLFFSDRQKSDKASVVTEVTNLRIGWQIPWAVQGQLAQILKRTSLLSDNGINADFRGFSYGGPLNEAAIAGDLDVVFTADQPAATLLSKNQDWIIIGRLMYNRVALYVPPASPIIDAKDLKGKTVAMPFGAAAQRLALQVEQDAGLDAKKEVKNINLGIYEQSDLVRDAKERTWGNIDAMAGFDPTPAIFEDKGLIRNIAVGKVVSVVLMSKDLIEKNPKAPEKFMAAFHGAYSYYRAQPDEANKWFTEESKLNISARALEISASLEPNLQPAQKIRVHFIDEDYETMQQAADFLYDQGLIDHKVIMREYVNDIAAKQVSSR